MRRTQNKNPFKTNIKSSKGFGTRGKDNRCLLLGLDASGTTTILYRLKLGDIVTTIPTIGFNVETVESRVGTLTLWDVGGQDKLRPLWRHYYESTDIIIFVVDITDKSRHSLACDELQSLLSASEMSNAKVLLVANKMDLAGSVWGKREDEVLDETLAAMKWNEIVEKRGEDNCFVITTALDRDVAPLLTAIETALNGGSLLSKNKKTQRQCEEEELSEAQLLEAYRYRASVATERLLEAAGAPTTAVDLPSAISVGTPTPSAAQAVVFPSEVMAIVVSYIPSEDLLPTTGFHFGSPGGAWFVNRTFMTLSFDEMAMRFTVGSGKTFAGKEGKELCAKLMKRLRPTCFLQVPSDIVPAHVLLTASVAACASYVQTGADLSELFRMEVRGFLPPFIIPEKNQAKNNPASSAFSYGVVRALMFVIAQLLTTCDIEATDSSSEPRNCFSLTLQKNDIVDQYMKDAIPSHNSGDAAGMFDLAGLAYHILDDLAKGIAVLANDPETFLPPNLVDDDDEDDDEVPHCIHSVQVGGPVFCETPPSLQALIASSKFKELYVSEEQNESLMNMSVVKAIVNGVLLNKTPDLPTRKVNFEMKPKNGVEEHYLFDLLTHVLPNTAPHIKVVIISTTSGTMEESWRLLNQNDALKDRFYSVELSSNKRELVFSNKVVEGDEDEEGQQDAQLMEDQQTLEPIH